jgi:hypothetical protein
MAYHHPSVKAQIVIAPEMISNLFSLQQHLGICMHGELLGDRVLRTIFLLRQALDPPDLGKKLTNLLLYVLAICSVMSDGTQSLWSEDRGNVAASFCHYFRPRAVSFFWNKNPIFKSYLHY